MTVALLLCGAAVLAAAGCGSGEHAATRALRTKPPPHAVVDGVRVIRLALPATGSLARCLGRTSLGAGRVLVVTRTGVVTRSVTIARTGSPQVFACDKISAPTRADEWCGSSAGILRHGRLRDPRLDILCVDRNGRHVAAAWVNPAARARWIGVDQGAYTELFPTAARLPVRIASTRHVDYGRARATFSITQYAADGHPLSHTILVTQVAG